MWCHRAGAAVLAFACLGSASLPAAWPYDPRPRDPRPCVQDIQPQAKLQGHTSKVHPTKANHDRDWNVEGRWKAGEEYKPQDGEITENPEHAPVARNQQPTPKSVRPNKLQNHGHKGFKTMPCEKPEERHKGNTTAEDTHLDDDVDDRVKELQAFHKSTYGLSNSTKSAAVEGGADVPRVRKIPRPRWLRGGRSAPCNKEPKLSTDKLQGHTSKVHPTKANHDRDWYVEGRWKAGEEYKPQDGEITEQPRHAAVPRDQQPTPQPLRRNKVQVHKVVREEPPEGNVTAAGPEATVI